MDDLEIMELGSSVHAEGFECGRAPAINSGARIGLASILFVVFLGVVCRVRLYAARTSYWNDEAFVVLNVMDHRASQLIGPLDYNQAAPPGFLWIERAAAVTLGTGEYSLRLFPLLAGIGSLTLFALLAWRVLPGSAALCAVGWYAFADKLIGYSAEVKQYSSDALIAVWLMLIGIEGLRRVGASKAMGLLSIAAAIAVWFSHPVIFVFSALGIALLWRCWRAGWRGRIAWIAGNALVLGSFLVLYRVSIVREQDPFLYRFWGAGFPPTDHPLRVPGWLGERFYELARQPYPPVSLVTGLLAVLGLWELAARRRWIVLAACAGPIVLAILASFARRFPFAPSRLTLFLLPGLILLCGAGAAMLIELVRRRWRFAAIVPLALLAYPIAAAAARVVHPYFHSHIRPVVQYVRAHHLSADTIFIALETPEDPRTVQSVRHLEFFCYWRRPDIPVHVGVPSPVALPHGRFWIVYSFTPMHRDRFIDPILADVRTVAVQQQDPFIDRKGGGAYLFTRSDRQGE